jgi:hypothetical protein
MVKRLKKKVGLNLKLHRKKQHDIGFITYRTWLSWMYITSIKLCCFVFFVYFLAGFSVLANGHSFDNIALLMIQYLRDVWIQSAAEQAGAL